MKSFGYTRSRLLVQLLICSLLCAGFEEATAVPYDYTASVECLEKPYEAQYSGGIISNPEVSDGLNGWQAFGSAKIEHGESGGNKFLVATSRSRPFDSISQRVYLHNHTLYTFSAWIQVNEGSAPVTAIFKTSSGYKLAGAVDAKSKCWSMIKGGVSPDESGFAELYFESKNTGVDVWVDSVSLQPFTQEEWRAHQEQSIETKHRTNVRIQAVDGEGKPLKHEKISISQKNLGFPVGCALNRNILNNSAYQEWFASRFKLTVFENEMKWYSTERTPGHEDYSTADAMLQFTQKHNIAVRGHNIFWDDPKCQPSWVNSLSPTDLAKAAEKRINSVVSKYKGQVIAWDVVNENLHFSFFESKLGQNASGMFVNKAHALDGGATMFMNEYNTIEERGDHQSTPDKYLNKLNEIKQFPGNQDFQIAIGLEAHFGTPDLAYMRAAIDTLAATGSPIWLTEVDVKTGPNQAMYLEQVLREAHAHPKIQGIVIWGAWDPKGCYRMCLTDNNFKNLATGDVVDKLLREWGSKRRIQGETDAEGFFDTTLFHGSYDVKIGGQANVDGLSVPQNFQVPPADATQTASMFIRLSA